MFVPSSRAVRPTPSTSRVVPPSRDSKEVHVGRVVPKPGPRDLVTRTTR